MKTFLTILAAIVLYVQPVAADEYYPLKTHLKAFTGTSSSLATPTSSNIDVLRISCTAACYVAFASTPTAGAAGMAAYAATPSASETTSIYIPADLPEYFRVSGRVDVAVIQVSAGGTLHVTEMSK